MARLLTLGQQLILSRQAALGADYQDPRQPALDLESKDVRAAAQLTLFAESTKASIRKQIVSNGAPGTVASEAVGIKVISTVPIYDVLSKLILVPNAVPSRALSVWGELMAWFHAEGLQVSIYTSRSAEAVRGFYELQVRAAVQL